MKKNYLINQKGSLLLEALVSVVVLSVSISLIIQSMTAGLRASVFTQDASLALIEAENTFSKIKSGQAVAVDQGDIESPRYGLSVEESSVGKLKQYQTVVQWTAGSKQQSISASTYEYISEEK